MDKRAFLTELKNRGVVSTREEAVAAMQKWRDNGGTFDDEVSRETPSTVQPAQPASPAPTVGDQIKGFGKRTMERARAVEAPTVLGEMAGQKPGSVGEAIIGTPERAMRLGLGAVGTLADIPATVLTTAASGYNQLLGGVPGKAAGAVARGTGLANLAQMYGNWKHGLPESAKANISAAESGLGALGMKGGAGAVGVANKTAANIRTAGKSIDDAIELGINKGIKPTVKNKSNYTAMNQFNEKAKEAVKTMAENKDVVKLVDDAGEPIAHPRTAAEMAQAIEKTKQVIYKQYHDMAITAGDKGAEFSFKPVGKELDRVSSDIKNNPQIRNYAQELKTELSELDGAAPEVIEARIADLNKSLNGFYEGRVSKVKAEIDASTAQLMRRQLDDIIENAAGDGYQKLKNQYGALKAIEKEVNHRAIVNARRATKTTADLTDIFTGGDLVAGALSLNPALIAKGLVGRGIKGVYKELNRPDRYIEGMFKKAYGEIEPGPKTYATPEKSIIAETPNILTQQPAYSRRGVDVKGQIKKDTENRNRAKSRPASDVGARHKLGDLGRK